MIFGGRMKKRTKIIIGVVTGAILLPIVLIGIVCIMYAVDLSTPPDHSDDPLIPQGYIENDGKKGYSPGEHEDFCYYVYSEKPTLDSSFKTADGENTTELAKLFHHYRYDNDDDKPLLNSKNLEERITDGDYFYIAARLGDASDIKYGALIYFYDIEENVLFRLDYRY